MAEKFEKNGGPHRPQQKGVLLIKKFIYIEVPQKVFLTPQHNFYSVWYQSKTSPFQTLSGPTWILWGPVAIQHGGLKNAMSTKKIQKNPMNSPTGPYLAQHGFYSVWYQCKTGPFKNLSGPTWILWLSVPI